MKNVFVTFMIALILVFASTFAHAQAIAPTLDRDNVWGGINVYTPGNLQLSSPIAPCPSGEFATGLDATFAPICSTAGGGVGVCLESFLSSADGHSGQDYGYAFNSADAFLASQNLSAAAILACSSGSHKVWTPMLESWPVALFNGGGSIFIPQSGGASGVWGDSPVTKTNCTVTAGNTTVSCATTTGLAAGMTVGGIGLGAANHIVGTPVGTTLQLAIPATLTVSGITTLGSNQVCGLNTIRGLANGQGISGTGIPVSTTITAITASSTSVGQCITISNPATATSTQNLVGTNVSAPVALAISGAWTANITAETSTPVLEIPYNASAVLNWSGQNYTGKIEHLTIQDSSYRNTTGVAGVEVWGQDGFDSSDVSVYNIKGTCLTLGGFDSSRPLRESFFSDTKCVNDGDLPTGQSAIEILSNGSSTADEINQIKFSGGEIVYPHGEGVTIGTYIASHQQSNGPRIIFFGQNWQTEGGTADPNAPNIATPADIIHVTTGSQIYFDGAELAVPGYGRALYQQDNTGASNSYEVNGSSLISAGNRVNCTVTVVNGSPNITLPSTCIPQDNTFDGVGVQIGGVDYWFIPQGSVSGTTATLTSNYAAASGSATMTIGAGGFFFFNTSSVTDTRTSVGNIWIEIDPLAISLLGFGSPIVVGVDQGYLPGRGVNDNLGLLSYNTLDVNGNTTLRGLLNTPGGIFSNGVIQSNLEGLFSNPTNIPFMASTGTAESVNQPGDFLCPNTPTGDDCALFLGLNNTTNGQSTILGWHNASPGYGWLGVYGANQLITWSSSAVTTTVPLVASAGLTAPAGFTATGATNYVQEPIGNSFYPSFNVNFIGKVFSADGFSSYGGVGRAVTAFSSSADVPLCSVVSNSGSYYIAVNPSNHTTTPGTFYGVWYPVPNNLPSTNVDCASYFAAAFTRNQNTGATVTMGSGNYTMNQGFVEPTGNGGFADEFSVSFSGAGQGVTYLSYTGDTAIPMFQRPTGADNFSSVHIYDMTLDGGGVASSVMDMDTLNQSYFFNLSMGHVAPGSVHEAQFSHTGGFGFQVFTKNINVGVFPDANIPNCAQVTASGTTTIAFTVTNGGTCYKTPTASLVAHVQLRGTQAGTSSTPCSVTPTGGGVPVQ